MPDQWYPKFVLVRRHIYIVISPIHSKLYFPVPATTENGQIKCTKTLWHSS
jgi:hypothetical protein